MARGNQGAQTASTNAYSDAQSLYGPLSAELQTQAVHPSGIDPATMAQMDTSALQSGGGSTAAAVGQGALRAARTRNAGGADAATAAATRTGGEIASKGILANRVKNAELKVNQQGQAESGLNNLFAENLSGGTAAVNANTGAQNASWDWASDLLDPMASNAVKAYGISQGVG